MSLLREAPYGPQNAKGAFDNSVRITRERGSTVFEINGARCSVDISEAGLLKSNHDYSGSVTTIDTSGFSRLQEFDRQRAMTEIYDQLHSGFATSHDLIAAYLFYLALIDQGYKKPDTIDPNFYSTLESILMIPRGTFFSPGLYSAENYELLFEADPDFWIMRAQPDLSFTIPWHTLVLDYLFKAYTDEYSKGDIPKLAYIAFLELLKEKSDFFHHVRQYCILNEDDSTTHPDFFQALTKLTDLNSVDLPSMMDEIRTATLCNSDQFSKALDDRRVYTTSWKSRYLEDFRQLAAEGVLDSSIQVSTCILDIGSGLYAYSAVNLLAAMNGARQSRVNTVICIDGSVVPQPDFSEIEGADKSIDTYPVRAILGRLGGLLTLPADIKDLLEANQGTITVIAGNSIIPHSMHKAATYLSQTFSLQPQQVILVGGFYDVLTQPNGKLRYDIFTRKNHPSGRGYIYTMESFPT